jgi:hypothetical protein
LPVVACSASSGVACAAAMPSHASTPAVHMVVRAPLSNSAVAWPPCGGAALLAGLAPPPAPLHARGLRCVVGDGAAAAGAVSGSVGGGAACNASEQWDISLSMAQYRVWAENDARGA